MVERDARRHLRENVGLVRQQDDRIVAGDARQRAGQIVDAFEMAVADPMSELIAEAGEPEALAFLADVNHVVFHQRHGDIGEGAAHGIEAVPPVVIAEDGVDAERGAQAGKLGRPGGRRHALGDETVGGEIIAQHHDQIGLERLRGIDHLAHARDPHIGAAGVDVGDHGDG